jgi:hypothetical protein
VTGALIATAVNQPFAAIPLAFMSHFVLDALPHYGDTNKRSWLNRNFKYILAVDILLASIFLGAIVLMQPASWFLLALCGVIAASPDILWFPYFLADLRHEEMHDTKLAKFLKWIQWGERPWGIYLEVVVLVGLVTAFLRNIS